VTFFFFDAHYTHLLYSEGVFFGDPMETNHVFRVLVGRMGFRSALTLYFLIEVIQIFAYSAALFLAFRWAFGWASFPSCMSALLSALAIAHADAGASNSAMYRKIVAHAKTP